MAPSALLRGRSAPLNSPAVWLVSPSGPFRLPQTAGRGHVNTRTRGQPGDAATSAARILPPPRVRSAGSAASLGDFARVLVRPGAYARKAPRRAGRGLALPARAAGRPRRGRGRRHRAGDGPGIVALLRIPAGDHPGGDEGMAGGSSGCPGQIRGVRVGLGDAAGDLRAGVHRPTAARIAHAAFDAASGTARGGASHLSGPALPAVPDPWAEDRPGRVRGVPARGPSARPALGAGAGPPVAALPDRTLGPRRDAGPGRLSA